MLRRLIHTVIALVMLGVAVAIASPAHAAGYRDLKNVRYGSCLYAYSDPIEDLYQKRCTTKPAKYGNWAVTNAGYYNGHQLWILRRQGGTCLEVGGSTNYIYLRSGCDAVGSKNVWEVFPANGRYVLKSFGAYKTWGQHKCLNFTGNRPHLAACSLTSTTTQIYR
jgi:hypothetical protein